MWSIKVLSVKFSGLWCILAARLILSSSQFLFDCQCQTNPTYVGNFSFAIFNDTEGVSRFNLSMTQKVIVLKYLGYVNWKGSENPSSKVYDKDILKANFNTCKISKGVIGNFFVKIVTDRLIEHSNFNMSCPQREGFYHATNFPIAQIDHLPTSFIGSFRNWELILTMKAKVSSSKALVHIMTLKFYGGNKSD
jgi:Protein of unknown function (DUF1091)